MPAAIERLVSKVFGGLSKFNRQNLYCDATVIVGASEPARLLAYELTKCSSRVAIVDSDKSLCDETIAVGAVDVICGDPTSSEVLDAAGAASAGCIFAATTSDELNLNVCQLAETVFDTPRLIAAASENSGLMDFELLGFEVMSFARAAVNLLQKDQLTPGLIESLQGPLGPEILEEIDIVSPASIGRRLDFLPRYSREVINLERGGIAFTPTPSMVLQMDDKLTVFGNSRAIETLREQLNPSC